MSKFGPGGTTIHPHEKKERERKRSTTAIFPFTFQTAHFALNLKGRGCCFGRLRRRRRQRRKGKGGGGAFFEALFAAFGVGIELFGS